MTRVEEGLVAIRASPDDDAPRLALADVLRAAGDPRGELIEVQCALARGGPAFEAAARLRMDRGSLPEPQDDAPGLAVIAPWTLARRKLVAFRVVSRRTSRDRGRAGELLDRIASVHAEATRAPELSSRASAARSSRCRTAASRSTARWSSGPTTRAILCMRRRSRC